MKTIGKLFFYMICLGSTFTAFAQSGFSGLENPKDTNGYSKK